MDLTVYIVIAVVFVVSLCFLLIINKQLRGDKTYEEVLAEKRQFVEKLYGPKKKNAKKPNAGGKKNRERNSNKEKSPKPPAVESDQKSESGSELDQSTEPPKLHVEFTEAEIIAPDTNTVTFKRQLSTGKLNAPAVRKNSATKPPGSSILVNKSTNGNSPRAVNGTIEPLNNFEKSHPKDDLEIKKQRDESIGRAAANAAAKKDGKKSKPNNKKDASPSVDKVTTLGAQQQESVDGHLNVPVVEVAIVAAPPKDSPKNATNKEKSNKKKRNDALLVQQLVDAGVASSTVDEVNVNAIITLLGRSELTRSEIQILIDFLLNKQQDTANVTHSDWSDDIAHKLRKQLEEKERVLIEEQKASLALHQKLREMRAEWNGERIANIQKLNASSEEANALKLDLSQLQQDAQLANERHAAEKQQLNSQLQHLQQKLFQEKNNQSQESAQKIQQLTDANALTAAELLSKNAIVQDLQEKFMRIRDESLKKIADYEQKFQEYVHKSETDVGRLTAENQQLRNECQRKDEYEKLFAIQKYECESLEARLAEQSKATNQMDDNSKVEIRNLQNALDSTKAELAQRTTELSDGQIRLAELTNELAELKQSFESGTTAADQAHSKQVEELSKSLQLLNTQVSEKDQQINEYKAKLENASADKREEELFKQIADYKEKNNELRKKNWKLVDALQKVEESAFKISSKCNLVAANSGNQATASPSKRSAADVNNDLIVRTKQVFERLYPNVPSNTDYDAWLTNLSKHIEQLNHEQQQQPQQSNHQSLQNNNSKPKAPVPIASTNGDEAAATTVAAASNGNHSTDNGGAASASTQNPNEELVLQNAKLKTTVDEYKTIIAETEGLLTHLEKKVKEQDSYWRNVVQTKDSEIRSLQQNAVPST